MRKLFIFLFLGLGWCTPVWGDSILPDSLLQELEGKTGKARLDVWRAWHRTAKHEKYDIPTYLGSLDYYCKDLKEVYAKDSVLYWCFQRKLMFAGKSDTSIKSERIKYKDILEETKILADSVAAVFGSPHKAQIDWYCVYAEFWESNGEKKKSTEYLELALELNETVQNEWSFFYIWSNLSYMYTHFYDEESAEYKRGVEYMKKAEMQMDKAKVSAWRQAKFIYEIGAFYRNEGEYEKAKPYFQKTIDSLHIFEEKNRVFYKIGVLRNSILNGQANEVLADLETLYTDPKVRADDFMWNQLLSAYQFALAKVGDYDKLLIVNKEKRLRDWQSEKEWMEESIDELNNSFELFEKEVEVKSLEQERVSNQSKFRVTLLVASLIGLLALVSLFLYLKVNKSKRERLSLKQEQEKQISENRNRLFSSITHDIRTPLALMMGPVERAKQKARSAHTIADLNMVTRNGQKLMDLFTQILDWNKVESDALYLNPQIGALEITIPLILKRLEQQAIEQGILLKSNLEILPGQFKLDFDKLEKVLVNISKNTFKFCPPGSQYLLDIKTIDNSLVLSLKDNGPGILKTDLPFVFDRYFQGVNGKEKGGTGIGLAIVKEIVDLMKGTISLESSSGKGTHFLIQLPIEFIRDSEVETVASNSLGKENLEKPKIIIVEDEPELLTFIQSSLQDGFEVTTADSATIGWSLSQSQMPDIVISDWNLPDETGGWLCNKIKTNSLTGHIPVLILTANDSDLNRKEAFSAGAVAWMGKPFRLENLQKQLQTILNQQSKAQKLWVQNLEAQINEEVQQVEVEQVETDPFMDKVLALIRTNFSKETFSVEQMADDLGIHRVQLSRKIKTLSGKRPSVLIKEFRLNKAQVLLKTSMQSVSEIAYAIGFSNSNYFATSYKKHFGISPSQEREDK